MTFLKVKDRVKFLQVRLHDLVPCHDPQSQEAADDLKDDEEELDKVNGTLNREWHRALHSKQKYDEGELKYKCQEPESSQLWHLKRTQITALNLVYKFVLQNTNWETSDKSLYKL